MTSIALFSDLHREVSLFSAVSSMAQADVIVLAGDIDVGLKGVEWANDLGKPVIYVPGNHEYEGADVHQLEKDWIDNQHRYPNVHVLQERMVVINGVRFLGCTLWTDFEFFGYHQQHLSMSAAAKTMPEYQKTTMDGRLLRPGDTLALHHRQRGWLKAMLDMPFDGPTVVVTHHAPHAASASPRFAHEALTAAFVNNLDDLLGRPLLWCHGHTHTRVDYWVDDSHIVSHPRGYHKAKDAVCSTFDKSLLFQADVSSTRVSRRKNNVAGSYDN